MIQIESLADHPELVECIAGWHFTEWGHTDPSATLAGWTEGLRQRTKRGQIPTTYVALEGDEPLGSVTLVEHDMRTHPDLSPWLAGVYVIPERHHQGIGSLLVRHAVQQVVPMGVTRLYLYTHAARVFYEKLGWRFLEEDVYEGQAVAIMAIDILR